MEEISCRFDTVADLRGKKSAFATPWLTFVPFFLSRNITKWRYSTPDRLQKPFLGHDRHPSTCFLDPPLILHLRFVVKFLLLPLPLIENLLTREPSQLINADFAYIFPICRGHYAKKNPKRVCAHDAYFEGYDHFTDFSAYGKVLTKKSNDEILIWNRAHM
jgi:hypothetical protein